MASKRGDHNTDVVQMLFVRVFLIRTNVFDSYEYGPHWNYTLVRDSYAIRNAVLAFVRVIFRTNRIRATSRMRANNCGNDKRYAEDTQCALRHGRRFIFIRLNLRFVSTDVRFGLPLI